MAVSTVKAEFNCDREKVWNVVTDLTDWSWRSDLNRIEIVDKDNFIEYTKDGYATNFTITKFDIHNCYEFDMKNGNMYGHWIGIFEKSENGTTICFTEDVTATKFVMKPFVGMYLKKQQKQFINDLKKALSK